MFITNKTHILRESYDKNGNLIYCKNKFGYECWAQYNEGNREIYFENSRGFKYWSKYDLNNNLIHSKGSNGIECWYKYDENNEQIKITQQEFKQIERRKEKRELYLNIKKSNRFEIMDI